MNNKYFQIHNLFLVGLFLKALNGFFELFGSLVILFSDFNKWPAYLNVFFREELIEDPGDLVANLFIGAVSKLDVGVQFSSFLFLFSHGAVKLILVWALIKKKYIAYPISEFVLGVFILYQSYLYYLHPSVFIVLLNIIDIGLMILIWLEYKNLKNNYREDSQ